MEAWLDVGNGLIHAGERTIAITPTQTRVLMTLIQCQEHFASADHLIAQIWTANNEPAEPKITLRVHICKLRRYLRPSGLDIVNRHSWGYKLEGRWATKKEGRPEDRPQGALCEDGLTST